VRKKRRAFRHFGSNHHERKALRIISFPKIYV
jgi:hypothetical protein